MLRSILLVALLVAFAGCLGEGPQDVGAPLDNATGGNSTNATGGSSAGNGSDPTAAAGREGDDADDRGHDADDEGDGVSRDDGATDPDRSTAWPREGSTVRYAMRFGQALPSDDGYYETVIYTNVTTTYRDGAWSGTCRVEEHRHDPDAVPEDRFAVHEEPWTREPLRETADAQVGDVVQVDYLRRCEVHTTDLTVTEKTTRDGREVWVARSPASEREYHEETAWWDAESGLSMGWELLRLRSNDTGDTTVA